MIRSLRSRGRLAILACLFAGPSAFAADAPKAKPADAPAFQVAEPSPNLWYGRFGITICSWIDTGEGVLVIDTGATAKDAQNLRSEIARTTKNKPIKWIALTHLHSDSNDGFASFLPTDATVFVNVRATGILATSFAEGKTRPPTVIGVSDRIAFVAGKRAFEIGIPTSNAHTAYDMYVFDVPTRTVFVGDLVTPNRCPMLSDPDSDLKGWIGILERFDSLGAQGLVPSRLDPTPSASGEIEKTRRYLRSMLAFLTDKKKQNAPEARVTGELATEKMVEYCPRELNAINALSVYRRIQNDGTTVPGSAVSSPAPKQAK